MPREIPDGQIWRYGMGVPFQVAPTIAGLFCNIGCNGGHDFEMGTDVVLFDQLSEISSNNAIPIARSHEELNPRNGKPYIIAKYTMRGGFVPFGAKRTDGSAHPHAGTGFGICLAVGFRKDMSIKPWRDEDSFSCLNFYQFSYDGEKFRVNSMDQDSNFHLPGGWKFHSLGMVNAVASNDDLLFTMAGSKPDSGLMAGVVRFQRKEEKWQPVSFTPIAPNGSEPSLVRDQGETWLFSARDRKNDITVWKSDDNILTWNPIIHVTKVRAATPVVLGKTANGIPYIIGNKLGSYRAISQVWPLNPQRSGLEEPIIVRDPLEEFGPTPGGDPWRVDIPSSGVVRLKDEKWHSLLTYRVCSEKEAAGGGSLTKQTGCYVEEVQGNGPSIPEWNF